MKDQRPLTIHLWGNSRQFQQVYAIGPELLAIEIITITNSIEVVVYSIHTIGFCTVAVVKINVAIIVVVNTIITDLSSQYDIETT